MCMCVCVCERERERERVCVRKCVRAHARSFFGWFQAISIIIVLFNVEINYLQAIIWF